MRCDEAIRRLGQHEAELRKIGVRHLYLFGSAAWEAAGDAWVAAHRQQVGSVVCVQAKTWRNLGVWQAATPWRATLINHYAQALEDRDAVPRRQGLALRHDRSDMRGRSSLYRELAFPSPVYAGF